MFLFACLACAPLPAAPVIGPGKEDAAKRLFETVGSGETTGWTVSSIEIRTNEIVTRLTGPGRATLELTLGARESINNPIFRTRSFDAAVTDFAGISEEQAREIGLALAKGVSRADNGDFFEEKRGKSRTIAASSMDRPLQNSSSGGPWLTGAVLLLILIMVLAGSKTARDGPLRSIKECMPFAAIFLAALGVRLWLVHPGPANFYSHIPIPGGLFRDAALFGPGHPAWLSLWFVLLGPSDTTAFLAGSIAGSLTAVATYFTALHLFKSKAAAATAGVLLAFWPFHAILSSTDDAWVLAGLLTAVATASLVAAYRNGSGLQLFCAWLAAGLAACTRPEAALSFIPIGLPVLVSGTLRRAQAKPAVAVATSLLLAGVFLSMYPTVASALSMYEPWDSLSPFNLARLAGLGNGSVLNPPRTPISLGLMALAGMLAVFTSKNKGLGALVFLACFLPAVPTAGLAGPGFVTARYQMPMATAGAVFAAGSVSWIKSRVPASDRLWILILIGVVGSEITALATRRTEPTFRLEYDFFRDNIKKVPSGCTVLEVTWKADLGLAPPRHLSELLGLGHHWIPASTLPDPSGCTFYWRPGACSTDSPDSPAGICEMVESAYVMEPAFETLLPARPGFMERYLYKVVRVGMYRLKAFQKKPMDAWAGDHSGVHRRRCPGSNGGFE